MTGVPTARGDVVDGSDLGFTLLVETVFNVNQEISINWPDVGLGEGAQLDGRIEQAIEILTEAKRHGVDTIVDRVIPGIGRDVRNIKRIAEAVPLNILVCTGWFTNPDLPAVFLFREVYGWGPRDGVTLENLMVADIEDGIAGTGVRAAMIKLVTDREGLTPEIEHTLRAGARAHRRTGAPITTHTGIGTENGRQQQRVLEEEGVDLSRVLIGHLDKTPAGVPIDEFVELIEKGSYLSFDMLSIPPVPAGDDVPAGEVAMSDAQRRVARIVELCELGHADRIVISQDQGCWTDMLPEGLLTRDDEDEVPRYTQVRYELIPALRERGISAEQIDQITLANPRRLLETLAAGPY